MKDVVRFITEEEAYRFKPNNSIESDIFRRVKYIIDNQEFAGNFYSSSWTGGGDGYLYELDLYDKWLTQRERLKKGEKIYRYFTRMSAMSNSAPLIKINVDKGLLYFMKPEDYENPDLIEFETKGIPARYLNIIPMENEQYEEGGELQSFLSSHKDMYDDNAKTITKQDVIDFIPLTLESDKKYWVKDTNSGYSYYVFRGQLRANDTTEGIFKATIISTDRLKSDGKFKIQKEDLFDWEKAKDPTIKKTGWDLIKKKFDDVFWMEKDGEDEIFANEVKLHKPGYRWDGRPSQYDGPLYPFNEATDIFLNSLTPEEKSMIDVNYNIKEIHELFGVMSEKRISVTKAKKDFLKEIDEINFDDKSLYMKNGGKTYDVNDLVGKTLMIYFMGVEEPNYDKITEVRMSAPHFSRKTLTIKYTNGRFEFEDVIDGDKINDFLSGEQIDLRDSSGEYYGIQLMKKMKEGGKLEGGIRKDMLYDKNGERRVDPEALAYIENTVEMLPQTKFMYTKENGEYTPERKKLHEKIIGHFHEGKPCINKRPAVAILTGGAPASGKTTFIKKYVDLDPEKVYHVDADEVRAMLPEYKGWNATQTHLETADLVNRLIDEIGVPCDHDLIYDGTMNKATKYEKIVDKLHKLGYKVFVVYISIPEQISKERVIARYKKAGRYVPMKVIEEVYDNGLTAFEKVAHEMADGYIRIDGMNGDIIEQGGMAMPSNIEYEKGGSIEENKLKNGTALVRSAERFAEKDYGQPVKKGKGMARASKKDGKMKYSEVIVFFENGENVVYDESEFPKFFMESGGALGSQDYYDGFQMQVVQKRGLADKEVQKENVKMNYRKGGKL